MSMHDEINRRLGEKRLFRLLPLLGGEAVERTMLVSDEVYRAVSAPADADDTYRISRLRADLDAFTEGKVIGVAENPFSKPKSTYMARVAPPEDEVWDIRSRDPKPGIRILGCFAETDVFVALVWAYREDLGGPDSKEWRDFIVRCKAEWRKLFSTYPPHSGAEIHDYVSDKFLAL